MERVNRTRPARRSAGFTLIELLVVIAIIALLMGILLPAFGRARDLSRSVATGARVTSLADACEMFKQDNGAYPGATRWLAPGPVINNPLRKPFGFLDGNVLAGSQQLALCLLDYYWVNPLTWDPMSAHLVGRAARPPRRYADLVDSALDYDSANPGVFLTTRYNAILDMFPTQMPILYFVARPGQVGVTGIYKWEDNAGFDDRYLPDTCPQDLRDLRAAFYTLITRQAASGGQPARPYRQDSFILIAPGIDRQWFTGDDNRNFGK